MTQINTSSFRSVDEDDFASDTRIKLNFNSNEKVKPSNESENIESDILLNNFQIKKKRYKVLLNKDHIVWESVNVKKCCKANTSRVNSKSPPSAIIKNPTTNQTATTEEAPKQKESEYEKEQLSYKPLCECSSNILHFQDIIRISKGISKSESIRNAHKTLEEECEEDENALVPRDQYISVYYADRIVSSSTDCNRWQIRRLTLYNNDPYTVAKWHDNMKKIMRKSSRLRIRRLLVFINPYGGRKMGLRTYEQCCKPIIQLAGIDASCIITQRANQIRDILMSHDMSPYDAVCCVGGDGTVAETVNGLIWRAMIDQGLDLRSPAYIPKPLLPVGIIPAGSTDTIVYSLHGTSDAQTAAIHLVMGQRRGLDICSVRNRDGIIRFCTSVMGYGYLGDVAAKSEQYRWMGTKRYEYTGVRTFLLNRGYEAEVHMLLNDDESADSESSQDSICYVNCQRCNIDTAKYKNENCSSSVSQNDDNITLEHNPIDLNKEQWINVNHSIPFEKQAQLKVPIKNSELGNIYSASSSSSSINISHQSEVQNFPEKWRTVRGEFFMITGANISCACTRSPNGISRFCHLGDGHLDVVLVRKTNLLNNLRLVVNTMGRSGDVRNLPFVEVYRTRQLIFKTKADTWPQEDNSVRGSCQPIADSNDNNSSNSTLYSSWNCDGEVVNDLDITMTSHRQLIEVFMRGPYEFNKPGNSKDKSIFCCCNS